MRKYTCPCCGYLVFNEPPGSYDICPICYWEDDESQLRFPMMNGGANKMSLVEAQKNFVDLGATGTEYSTYTRKPTIDDQRDQSWRMIDELRDKIESPQEDKDYGTTYPKDSTDLYYWKSKSKSA